MSEIKYDSSMLSNCIDDIEQQCNHFEIDNYTVRDSSSNMPSCAAFIEEQQSLTKLLTLYKNLVKQDISDLRDMYLSAEELDKDISDSFDLKPYMKK